MFSKVLIANRGEIACRIISSVRRMGIRTVAVFSEADRRSLHVRLADEAACIGASSASASYLDGKKIIEAAKSAGADAIHPGYGFLSENPEFADDVEQAGMVFVGPSSESIRAMGLKNSAKSLMAKAGVPVVPGFSCGDLDKRHLAERAEGVGFPVLVKAVAGGGGKGMRLATNIDELLESLDGARREAVSAFGNGDLMVEKYVDRPRHIEVQVFGDRFGNAVHIFERDCSLQRRSQKLIEEAPAPAMPDEVRRLICETAAAAARAIKYENAGTVEFIADASEGLCVDRFWFLEMNTRLQVEHPVTEMISGLDLVEWQLRIAAGERIPDIMRNASMKGHSLEARIYAEAPEKGFMPVSGRITKLVLPGHARVDCGYSEGDEITPHYDALIAKVVVHGRSRLDARARLEAALNSSVIAGLPTNLSLLTRLARDSEFQDVLHDTELVERKLASGELIPAPPGDVVALAAVGAANCDGDSHALSNFTLWTPLAQAVKLKCGEHVFDAEVEKGRDGRFNAAVGGMTYSWRLDGDSIWLDGKKTSARLATHGDEIAVAFDGRWEFRVCEAAQRAASDSLATGRVQAPMPGLVRDVLAETGQSVEKGQLLLLLEAMKMEHPVVADGPGTIVELLVEADELVDEGQLLAILAPASATGG
ncbi:MAG: 3-methylcrotonyl-CoA carboxylase [Albidovulum sp.]|nr:3-methylcrotonyl-CoA carboxylase [Albidovulum sp.]